MRVEKKAFAYIIYRHFTQHTQFLSDQNYIYPQHTIISFEYLNSCLIV